VKHAFLLAAAVLVFSSAFPPATSAAENRLSEVERRLAALASGSYSGEEEEAFVALCRNNPEAISLLINSAAECNDSLASQQYFHLLSYLLTKLGQEAASAVPVLIDKLSEGHSNSIRHDAASTLGIIAKDSTPVAPLLEALKPGGDPGLRSAAAIALGTIGDPAAIPQMLVAALNDPDANVRTFTAGALGNFDQRTLEAKAGAKIVAAVELRPQVTNLSPVDAEPFEANLSYKAFLQVDGKELRTLPRNYVCDDDALLYEVTTPAGKKYRLTPRPALVPPTQPLRFDYGTSHIMDGRGIRWSPDGTKYWYHWKETDAPRFNEVGTYRIKQSGMFKDERGSSKPIAFESNETSYEVSSRFASNADLYRQARESLKSELGVDTPSIDQSIREDKDETKIVTLRISKQDYPEEKFGQRGHGNYFGLYYTCRFTPEGQLLSAVAKPKYRIICP
jgi:hypothetical protein